MNVSQALEYERQPFIPMFIYGDHGAMESERQKGEEALKVLETEYFTAEGDPGFDFATVRDLADRNRDLCDQIGEARLRNVTPATLSRGLSDADTCAAIGKMQKRTAASVMREIRGDRDALGVAYARKPIQGTVLGIDIETTGRAPERGYIINVGWEIMDLTSDAVPHDAEAHYCGLPDIYRGEDVPLSNIHHITWDDIDGKKPFRENKELQKQLLKLMKKYPYMAHNAAFEDSWFKIHLDGYAEARRAGKIIVIDSRQICRSLDADVRSLPRESAPAALENWARRRGTLAADANEQHLGLDDTDLMLIFDNIDADATIATVKPFVGYFYRDNNCIGIRFGYSHMGGTLDNTYFSQTAKAETTFVLWKRLVLRANADYNYYRGITDTFLEERLICNAMLGVKLFRNCLGEASVGVNDILDQNGTTFRRTVSGTTLRNVTNLAVGRYVSFQFTYNLRLFRRQSNAVMDALQGK